MFAPQVTHHNDLSFLRAQDPPVWQSDLGRSIGTPQHHAKVHILTGQVSVSMPLGCLRISNSTSADIGDESRVMPCRFNLMPMSRI